MRRSTIAKLGRLACFVILSPSAHTTLTTIRDNLTVFYAFPSVLPATIEFILLGHRILIRQRGSGLRRDRRKTPASDGQDLNLSMFGLRPQPSLLPPLERRIRMCPSGILLLRGSGSLLPLGLRLRLRRHRVSDLQRRILLLPLVCPQRRGMQQLSYQLLIGCYQALSLPHQEPNIQDPNCN